MAKKKKKLSDKARLRAFFQDAADGKRFREPVCRHFGDCGGCEFQDVPYREQCDLKRRVFAFIREAVDGDFRERAEALRPDDPEAAEALVRKADSLGALLDGVPVGLVESPREFGYRQRMDYVFAFGKAGLRRVNRHRQVVELAECPLLGEQAFSVVRKAHDLAVAAGLESYDYMRHTGELRYFVVRQSRNGQVLLSLVSKTTGARESVLRILQRLLDDGDIASGHWLLAPGLGDVSFGERLDGVGAEWIAEEMNGTTLRIGPNTFFQSNPAVAEQAYAAIRDFAPADGRVLDMYSGVGSIGLTISPGAGEVVLVENVPDNVRLAEINIRENRRENVALVIDDAARYLVELAGPGGAEPADSGGAEPAASHDAGPAGPTGGRPDMVVVNPPRPGVHDDGMAAIRRLAPEKLAYLSCNPFTLLRNLADIADGYRLRSVTVYDMFPETRHFETLALLERA
ncbi:MAG: RsmD family RNA methyltransferase [Planctomycetaceae bacterium]|nr:RsmD family RNA methyltransferase [Planctomycetaceae bacterium]